MEIMQVYDINSLCRACLSRTENMTPLFSNNGNKENIVKMFVFTANFEIEKNDSLPSYLCSKCEQILAISYDFVSQCRRTEELLQQYILNELNVKVPEADVAVESFGNTAQEVTYDNSGSSELQENIEQEASGDDVGHIAAEKKKENKTKGKLKMRLKEFSYHEVLQAIEDQRRKFYEKKHCIKCMFVGSNSRALSSHIAYVHKELKGRWCTYCNNEFDNLFDHLKKHDKENLTCQFCGKIFNAKGHLTEHFLSHTSVRPYKCDICDKSFISQRHVNIHCKVHSNERSYKCRLCPQAFFRAKSLKLHVKQRHKGQENTEIFSCLKCDNKFVSKEELEKHKCCLIPTDLEYHVINTSEDAMIEKQKHRIQERMNYCKVCNKRVRSLNLHRKQFHEEGIAGRGSSSAKQLCTVCGKQFKTISKLVIHMRIHTGEAPYKCSYCDRRLTTRNHLVVHERTHTGERPHVCKICKKAFTQSGVLNTHMRLHTGRPEVCSICGQRFCRPAELKLHMRKHTGEKPYSCNECGQAFIQRSHLMEHLKIHSGDRPYKCEYCERAFTQSSSLKTHARIHLGHKPYRCSQCLYSCRQSYSLTQHMKIHSADVPQPDKPHVCLICKKSYSTVAMLTSHATSVHGLADYEENCVIKI